MPTASAKPRREKSGVKTDRTNEKLSKGARTRLAILDAALSIIDAEGFAAASQDAIARQASISQSTLRHHFPTADELHVEVFRSQYQAYRSEMEKIVLRPWPEPIELVQAMVNEHLDHIIEGSDSLAFESLAFLSRRPDLRAERDNWLQWLASHYAAAIKRLRSELSEEECDLRGFEIITVTMGAWMSAGHSHPKLTSSSAKQLKARLLKLVLHIMQR